ncbi:MCP methyltransferase/methylesterase, CheR/CheB with PAS/PAC sensor [Sulfuricella denitrificans skB26]|uniref:protein-glutamate O-methyltransferase n=1 Tax=Sulfuricella denitrificans (strain DSM 22764 / NBRC 105220 / skB26) TaxID=1163617 RepID=S6AFT6_SULDS|nr:chemotaxis protein CheB [Sulfuricella denitrificans]BAN34776.1 MCP methyltransferase/methylesterase, CheR/CheB with PAS/PAC sensor [Sulfuricella denitrificans skB26]
MPKKSNSHTHPAQQESDGTRPEPTEQTFPVVGVGASAGGLDAFTKLLKNLPADTGMAFVLVQHLDPKHVSLLPELLGRASSMPVAEVSDGTRIKPNYVYVMPPNYSLAILHGVLHLMPRPDGLGKHLPIDDFLSSLAEDRHSNAIGVILSGTASDGTLGMRSIKLEGGITFAQSEDSAEYDGMPHSAIAAGHVDFVLTPEEIGKELVRIARHPYLRPEETGPRGELVSEGGDNLNKIFVLLRSRTGNDFTYYKHSTIRRRIKRRMVLHQLEKIEDYVKYLQKQPGELDALFQDILINVTSFFRDPETFDALQQEVFPALIEQRSAEQSLRIWVPGCSTGEEVYSVAITLLEFLGERASNTHIQIFASDIDDKAIDIARQGIYPESIRDVIAPGRLQRFFVKTPSGYQISKIIRDICVFALQNVAKDPPFSRLDLICCRNLMIYLGAVLQKKVLHTFHYALRPGRFLMLGTSETIGSFADLFATVDKKSKIYAKKSVATLPGYDFTTLPHAPMSAADQTAPARAPSALDLQHEAERLILTTYGPPGVIINQDLQILHFRGQTGPYIEPSPGSASLNLLKMARQDLVLELRSVVNQAIKERSKARKEGVRIRSDGGYRMVNLQVLPLAEEGATEPHFLVLFEPSNETPAVSPRDAETPDTTNLRIQTLEQELLSSREYMQSIIEEQEATNEELQSANEEIQSANEELQSTNEELETAKEELQSTNEELSTINEEHENRNLELMSSNNDLANLLASVELAIVILSDDLRIRRFTPTAKTLLNLIDADIGRPIGNIRPNVNIPDLEKQVREVIDTMSAQSSEVQDRDGRCYTLSIRPYKTLDNRIEGVVMSFINIDSTKKAEQMHQILQQERRLAAVVRDSHDAVTMQDFAGRILAWNRRAQEMYGYTEEEALQLNISVLTSQKNQEEMRDLIERLKRGEHILPFETTRITKDGREINVWLTVSALLGESGNPAAIATTEKEV